MSRSLRGTGRADGLLDLRMSTGAAAASPLLRWFVIAYAMPGTIRIYMACMIGRCFLVAFGSFVSVQPWLSHKQL